MLTVVNVIFAASFMSFACSYNSLSAICREHGSISAFAKANAKDFTPSFFNNIHSKNTLLFE